MAQQPCITEIYNKEMGNYIPEQPAYRTGDLLILSACGIVIGKTAAHHDLKALDNTLRSYSGRYEEMVPMEYRSPLNTIYKLKAQGDPCNFNVFDFTVNGTH